MGKLFYVLLFLGMGCAAPKKQPVDLSSGGKFQVVPIDGGSAYVIDATTRSCFLFLPEQTPAGPVNCYRLKAEVPAAATFITWKTESVAEAVEPLEAIEAPVAELTEDEKAIDAGVKDLSDNKYEIQRTLLDQVLENPAMFARGARIVPSIRGGKPNGFKLYAIRPNSLFAKIGLMNGDTVTNINSHELTTADKALEIYTQVREAKQFDVKVVRRTNDVALTYIIK